MQGDRSKASALLLLGALADEIADRLADRLAPHLAEIVEAGGLDMHQEACLRREGTAALETEGTSVQDDRLWTAGRVAAHYDVAVRFIYQHADELGCVRLGDGARPRLRFDPDVVRERWPRVGGTSESAPTRRRAASRPRPRRPDRASYELLDFDRQP